MNYTIKELKNINSYSIEDLLKTYDNLSPTSDNSKKNIKKHFNKMKKQGSIIFIATEKKSKKIIGASTLLLEYKILRGGVLAGHIEDVVVRKGYEGLGIGTKLIEKIMTKGKKTMMLQNHTGLR